LPLEIYSDEVSSLAFRECKRAFRHFKLQSAEVTELSTEWTITEALRIVSFHNQTVTRLGLLYAADCALIDVAFKVSLREEPPTEDELQRIAIALYRFELIRRVSAIGMSRAKQFRLRTAFKTLLRSAFTWQALYQVERIYDFLLRITTRRKHRLHLVTRD
jgi:hypothetical protein